MALRFDEDQTDSKTVQVEMVSPGIVDFQSLYIYDNFTFGICRRILCRQLQFRHYDRVDSLVGAPHALSRPAIFEGLVFDVSVSDLLRLVSPGKALFG